MKTLKIEIPRGYEVDESKSTFENIVFKEVTSPMQKVFEYHKTTEEQFDDLYKNIPEHVKNHERECMVVAFYNKGWKPDFTDGTYKHYPYFYMDNFRLYDVDYGTRDSDVSSRLLFKNESDCKEAVEVYKDVFKASRLG